LRDGIELGGAQPADVVRRRQVRERVELLDPPAHPPTDTEQGSALRTQLPRLVMGELAVGRQHRPEAAEPAEVVGALHGVNLTHVPRLRAMSLKVPVVRLDPDLPLPRYAHPDDAGLDLHAREDATLRAGGGRALVPTGIALAIPPGHAGFVLPRSGLALRHGISVVNAPGLIDAAYRGEVKVVLLNTDPDDSYTVHRGDRIAQLVVQRVDDVVWQEVDGLDGIDRGGGFGHSGR